MNKDFLEFWGNILLNAAKGQKQLEEISRWMSAGFNGEDEFTGQFKKFYGLDQISENDPDYLALWERSVNDFKNALVQYLALFDVVPKEKYEEVVRERDELKAKVESLESRIKALEALTGEKGLEYSRAAGEFQKMIEKQTKEFQKMLKSFAAPFGDTNSKKSGKEKD